jgi:hypothetical protein
MCFIVAIMRIASVALSGCCAPMLPLRGCRVSMRALGCRWRGEREASHKFHTCIHTALHISSTRATLSPHGGGVVFSSWSSDVAVKHIHIIARAGGRGGAQGKGERTQQTNVHYVSGGRGEPAQSGQRATRVSNTRRFTKSHRRRASEDRRK